jgi:hypothetical protein
MVISTNPFPPESPGANCTNIHKESISVAEDGFLFIRFALIRLHQRLRGNHAIQSRGSWGDNLFINIQAAMRKFYCRAVSRFVTSVNFRGDFSHASIKHINFLSPLMSIKITADKFFITGDVDQNHRS